MQTSLCFSRICTQTEREFLKAPDFFSRKKTWTKGSGGPKDLAVGEMSLSHRCREFISGMELAVPNSLLVLLMACWQAFLEMLWWLPVSLKVLGAYWSVLVNFSDCFVREVLENWPWKWSTLLCLKKQLLQLNRAVVQQEPMSSWSCACTCC